MSVVANRDLIIASSESEDVSSSKYIVVEISVSDTCTNTSAEKELVDIKEKKAKSARIAWSVPYHFPFYFKSITH